MCLMSFCESREFVGNNYDELKTLNPTTPFLIRARDGAKTELWVKYDFGQEEVRDDGLFHFIFSSLLVLVFLHVAHDDTDAEPG